MNTYEVKVKEVNVWVIKVEADSAITARDTAEDQILEHEHMGQFIEGHVETKEVVKL